MDGSVEGEYDYGSNEAEQEFSPKFVFQYPKDARYAWTMLTTAEVTRKANDHIVFRMISSWC